VLTYEAAKAAGLPLEFVKYHRQRRHREWPHARRPGLARPRHGRRHHRARRTRPHRPARTNEGEPLSGMSFLNRLPELGGARCSGVDAGLPVRGAESD